jgi:DHA2 family methylenomycin A resistance protein-like MFS transporter
VIVIAKTNSAIRPRRSARWALLATSLGFAVVQLDVSVVNVAIKPIGASLGGNVGDLQWIVNAYTVAFAALILSAGALGDRVGAKRVFLLGFVVFTLSSVLCGDAPNLGTLITARAIQGVGAAILVPNSLNLLNHAYSSAADRAKAIGLWAAGASVALSAGPMIGGLLIAGFGWRSIFFINAPIGILGIILAARFATETPRSPLRRLDVPGQLSGLVALLAIAAATVEGGQHGFTNPIILAGYVVALAATMAFLIIESHSRAPMLPLALFRSRAFSASTAIGLVINICFYGLLFILSLYFQDSRHLSPLLTGLAFAPTTFAVLAANLLAGRIAMRIGTRWVMAVGGALMALGLTLMLTIGPTTPFPAFVTQLIALGFGLGLVVPTMTSGMLGSVNKSDSGIASGTLNTARQTGSVIGVALFGSLASLGLVQGLHLALAIAVGLAIIVVALSLSIRRA